MALSGSVSTNSYDGRYLNVSWTATQSITNNTSTISWTLKGAGTGGSSWYYSGPIWVGFEQTNGTNIYSNTYWTSRQKLYDGTTVASGSFTIAHNTDGTKQFRIFIEGAIYTSAYNVNGNGTVTLNTIPRYANPVPTLTARTETSLSIAWTADGDVDQLSYSTDNGSTFSALTAPNASSGSFTITGLSVGTTYAVVLRARRTDSQLTNNSTTVNMATYSYPYAATMPDFTIGDAVTIGLFNPLGHNISVELYGGDGVLCGTTTTNGTSVTITPTAADLYASIPAALNDNYSVVIIYSANTETRTGGLYAVNPATNKPNIGTFGYADGNNTAVAITGDASKIVQNIGTPVYTATGLTGANAATISTAVVTVNAATVNLTVSGTTATGTGGVINSTADVTATLTVTDSRGITNTANVDVSMIAWSAPSAVYTVERQSNFYSETDVLVDATYTQIGTSTITITVLGQAEPIPGKTTPADVTATVTDNVQSTIVYDNEFAWNITITLTDSFGGTTTLTTHISRGIPFVYFDRHRNSVGVNQFPQHDNAVELTGGNYYLNNDPLLVASAMLDLVYPVGSIYMSVNATSPAALFGGTWAQIKDTFLLSAGDTYTGGTTGGEATHTLTTDEMPSHSHFQQYQSNTSYVGIHVKNYNSGGSIQGVQPSNGTRRNNIADPSTRVPTVATGGGQAHNNLPPYLVVYVWQRTA